MPPENRSNEPNLQAPSGSAGPVSGIIIILALLLFGALYFWGEYQNNKNTAPPVPVIPSDATTTIDYSTTTIGNSTSTQ